jgi:hypothetical protein
MMLAGYIGHRASWTTAGFTTVPGGIVILAALALARRADRADDQPAAPSGNHGARRVAGLATTLLSGGVMVSAGYAASAWGWGLAAGLATVGGLVVFIAFAFDRRGSQPTTR